VSWIYKSTNQRAREFHERRQREEGFVSGYIEPTPEWLLVKSTFLPPLKSVQERGGFYYMSLNEYTTQLLDVTNEVAQKRGWDYVTNVAIFAREFGMVKDPPLLMAELMPRGQATRVLFSYPPNLLLRYVELSRKARQIVGGLGRRKKAAVSAVMQSWSAERQELYAIKYVNDMKDLLRLVHPRPPNEEVSKIWRWILKGGEPPTPKIEAYIRMMQEQDLAKANAIALDARLPYETVRRKGIHPEYAAELLIRLATPITAYMMLRSLNYNDAIRVAKAHADKVPLSYGLHAVFGLWKQGKRELAFEVEKLIMPRASQAMMEVFPFGGKKAVFLIDVSGSMASVIDTALEVAYSLKGIAAEVWAFHEDKVFPVTLHDLYDVEQIKSLVGGNTPLEKAFKVGVERAKALDAVLLAFTDEMGNVFTGSNIIRPDVPTVVLNPTPYPSEHVIKEQGLSIGVPASRLDITMAALRYVRLAEMVQTERVVDAVELINRVLRSGLKQAKSL